MNGTVASLTTLILGIVAVVVGAPRWLRVAQREHYLPGSVGRFAMRWWALRPWNPLLAVVGVVAVAVGAAIIPVAIVAAVVATAAPRGLSWRGRTSKLVWTPRCRTLAGTAALVCAVVVGVVGIAGIGPAAVTVCAAALLTPLLVDLACVLTKPIEARRLSPFVRQASAKLAQVAPQVVAITGSYGKTSTKGYVAHLLSGSRVVVASPRSFNNRAGLARAINDGLAPGTEVFIAEMGTYGPGEIAQLCAWIPPQIAVITAIGPVHLERMGSEERIAAAKAEILERAPVVVLNVDHPLLADLGHQARAAGKKVWACSASDPRAQVVVRPVGNGLRIEVGAEVVEVVDVHAPPTNVACAVAVALELGVSLEVVGRRLPTLPGAEHRQALTVGQRGQTIIDDTYNANPAGAAAALATLERLGTGATRRVLVTPGMVELGPRQAEANRAMVAGSTAVLTHLVVVGATNASALVAGAAGSDVAVVRVRHRPDAVAWISAHTDAGDVVLYENDLPDHFP